MTLQINIAEAAISVDATNGVHGSYNLKRVRGDTKKIMLQLLEGTTPVDITAYTSFTLSVDTNRAPVDDLTNVLTIEGVAEDDEEGIFSFQLESDMEAGNYWYDVQTIDGDGIISTVLMGRLTLIQNITK